MQLRKQFSRVAGSVGGWIKWIKLSPALTWSRVELGKTKEYLEYRGVRKNRGNKTEVESVQLGNAYISDMDKCPQDK